MSVAKTNLSNPEESNNHVSTKDEGCVFHSMNNAFLMKPFCFSSWKTIAYIFLPVPLFCPGWSFACLFQQRQDAEMREVQQTDLSIRGHFVFTCCQRKLSTLRNPTLPGCNPFAFAAEIYSFPFVPGISSY